MTLYQYKDGYRYNSDTIFLYDFISNLGIKGEILDVGAGCGILGILLKRDFQNTNVTLLEIQKKNIDLICKNLEKNSINCNIIHSDFLEFNQKDKFDYIVSNPPFYHDGVKKSENIHKNISRYSSHLGLEELICNCYYLLKPRGSFYFCYDAKQILDISFFLKKCKFSITHMRYVYPKKEKLASLVLIKARKNSKSLCEILNPIYVFEGNEYCENSKIIFKKAGLKSVDV